MNNQLIEKVIKSNDSNSCPEFSYGNPLLDRNVAGALARSFVKILSVSQQDSNVNNNLRYSVLANIRKLCRIEPENHLEIDENFTKSLTEVYMDKAKETLTEDCEDFIERRLDEFLIRKMKEADLNANYQSSMNPEVIQALLNLIDNSSNLIPITKDVLHWNISDRKNLALVKNLWTNSSLTENVNATNICDDISIKMKKEIEIVILNLCHRILTDSNLQIVELFKTNILMDLVNKCSISAECFQICIGIMNYLFIHLNYNTDIQIFISKFIQSVKEHCLNSISVLYPINLSPIVVLLDVDLDGLQSQFKKTYVERTLQYLKKLHEESDVVMLLSHFPYWFDFYCDS